ncbi:MAG: hypothetical protein HYY24_09780 [Verrucomicrobia bacterium]|nr:hypothetical protein [Verrucomicrobiota bacterium]
MICSTGMLSERPWKPDAVLRLTMWMLLSISFGGLVVILVFPKGDGGPTVPPNIWAIIIGTLALHGVALLLTGVLVREHQLGWREAFGFAAPGRWRAERQVPKTNKQCPCEHCLAFGLRPALTYVRPAAPGSETGEHDTQQHRRVACIRDASCGCRASGETKRASSAIEGSNPVA